MKDRLLTEMQAYKAMYAYLSQLYDRTGSVELGILLSEMSFLEDGCTADPAAWYDWKECVKKSLEDSIDSTLKFIDEPRRKDYDVL